MYCISYTLKFAALRSIIIVSYSIVAFTRYILKRDSVDRVLELGIKTGEARASPASPLKTALQTHNMHACMPAYIHTYVCTYVCHSYMRACIH